ncbi:TPA: hypothetical protein ACR8TU_004528, partial [Enterobacter hormaechei]
LVMGHAVVSAKLVSPHPVFYVSRALSNATLSIASGEKSLCQIPLAHARKVLWSIVSRMRGYGKSPPEHDQKF